jgi:RNA polymerase sigma-70 factor (ECF subfamily)
LDEATAAGNPEVRAGEAAAREFEEAMSDMARDHDPRWLTDRCTPDVAIRLGARGIVRGRAPIVAGARADAAAGVSYQVTNVLASDRVVVVEGRFLNPPDDPDHCPGGVVQIHHRSAGWTRAIVMHYRD